MDIQWYPGHMAKAKRLLREQLKLVDVVLEVRDARIPVSSGNPDLAELLGNKKRIILLNKADLADGKRSQEWVNYFAGEGIKAIAITARPGDVKHLPSLIEETASETERRRRKKGMAPRPKRAMVVGIPNVGKSSLINSVIKRSSAKTGDKPGVTRGNQWVRVRPDLEFLDTPGLLWPKFSSPETGFFLAVTGAIRQEVYDPVEVAHGFVDLLVERWPGLLAQTYQVVEERQPAHEILIALGKKWGLLRAGGAVDEEKAAIRLLQDYRKGKLGSLTLEQPPDIE
ncbi:MAG: ribosome biogenesis GTPase YlqF [Clostridia bacterium]|jgi:ribosome biogenesis GTPase A|nr:ribosome biogenesis GTPase YlqF [Clostridia bacterium]